MEREGIRDQLKHLIIKSLRFPDLKPKDLPNDQQLLGSGLDIDSVDILQLIVDIERHFGIKLVTDEFDREAWKDLSSLAETIEEKLKAASSATSDGDFIT